MPLPMQSHGHNSMPSRDQDRSISLEVEGGMKNKVGVNCTIVEKDFATIVWGQDPVSSRFERKTEGRRTEIVSVDRDSSE